MPPKVKAFIDETGRIDPQRAPQPSERRAATRAAYGLPPKRDPNRGSWDIVDKASNAAAESAGGEDILTEATDEVFDERPILREQTDESSPLQEQDEPDARDLEAMALQKTVAIGASFTHDTDMLELQRKKWTSAEAYWKSVNALLDKRTSKELRRAAIGPGAAASTPGQHAGGKDREALARELQAIHEGKRGSPSSPKNSLRRRQIREQLRNV